MGLTNVDDWLEWIYSMQQEQVKGSSYPWSNFTNKLQLNLRYAYMGSELQVLLNWVVSSAYASLCTLEGRT